MHWRFESQQVSNLQKDTKVNKKKLPCCGYIFMLKVCEIFSSWSKIGLLGNISCTFRWVDAISEFAFCDLINITHPIPQRTSSICHLVMTWSFEYINRATLIHEFLLAMISKPYRLTKNYRMRNGPDMKFWILKIFFVSARFLHLQDFLSLFTDIQKYFLHIDLFHEASSRSIFFFSG